MQQFEVAIERLQRSPNRLAALKTMLDYLERARDHPRDIRARSVCLWEPAFRTHIATSDGGLQALQAAGFDEIAKDDRGTPFLVMRRLDQRVVRKVIAITAAKLASAEAEADYEGVAQASASVDGGDAGASGGGAFFEARPVVLFFGLVERLHGILKPVPGPSDAKAAAEAPEAWVDPMKERLRSQEQELLQQLGELLREYEEEFLVAESAHEVFDVLGLHGAIGGAGLEPWLGGA